jgi:hypothetical protein
MLWLPTAVPTKPQANRSERSAEKENLGLLRLQALQFDKLCVVQRGPNAVAQFAHLINTVRTDLTRRKAVVHTFHYFRGVFLHSVLS